MVPSKDVLPAFDVVPPMVEVYGPTAHTDPLPGIGSSKEIGNALFDELGAGMIAKKVYASDGNYVVIQETAKNQPKVEDFEKKAPVIIEQLRQKRAQAFLADWLGARCEELAKANRITPAPSLIHEFDDQGNPLPITYHPCFTMPHKPAAPPPVQVTVPAPAPPAAQ
jgi:hypothetical protein